MKYRDYLARIQNRIGVTHVFICHAVRADWWSYFSPNAHRLLREVRKLQEVEKEILVKEGAVGVDYDILRLPIRRALEKRYGRPCVWLVNSYEIRRQWLQELIDAEEIA